MLRFAMVAQTLAMVTRDHDRERPPGLLGPRPEHARQASQLLVHRGDLAEIGRRRVRPPKSFGRRVRRMRIEVVHPHELGLFGRQFEERQGLRSRLRRRSFHATRRLFVVIGLEPAREAEAPVEHEARDERRRPVSRLLQKLREDRMAGRQMSSVFVNAVTARIQPRHHRGVRRQRLGNGRVGVTEPAARDASALKDGVTTPVASGPIASARVVSSVTSRMDG